MRIELMRLFFLKTWLLGVFFLLAQGAAADEWDGLMGEFNAPESTDDYVKGDMIVDPDKKWVLTNTFILSSSWNVNEHDSTTGTNYSDLSQMRTEVKERLDYKFNENWKSRVSARVYYDWVYPIRDRDDYSDEVLDSMEWETELEETWVYGKLTDKIDIKAGRQIVNWGRSESIRVLDILNPMDNREIGMADIEDLRLPVTMIKTDFYVSNWTFNAIAIPETRFSKNPPYGNDYASVDNDLDEPTDIKDTSWAGAASATFAGWDISFHLARYWRDIPFLDAAYDGTQPLADRFDGSEGDYDRMTTFGIGGGMTQGSFLFKAELAYHDGIEYTTSEDVVLTQAESDTLIALLPPTWSSAFPTAPGDTITAVPSDTTTKDRVDLLLGLEYYGFASTTLTFETAMRHVIDFQPDMELAEIDADRLETSLRYTRSLMGDRFKIIAVAVLWGDFGNDGAMLRLSGEYDISNDMSLEAGFMDYYDGDLAPFNYIYQNDRLFMRLRCAF